MPSPAAASALALLAPIAMKLGAQAGVPALLTALMVANGANAGNLSPFSAVGVIANTKMAGIGLGGREWQVWGANFAAHVVVGGAAWLLFGGLRRVPAAPAVTERAGVAAAGRDAARMEGQHWLTAAVVTAWITGVAIWQNNVETAAVIIEAGANLTLKSHDGETALDFAKAKRRTAIAALIEKKLSAR